MKKYYLFLDESKPFGILKYFCLGGCIIEESVYNNEIIPMINNLKNKVFGDLNVNLHECEIRDADVPPYNILKDFYKKKEFWDGMIYIFSNTNFLPLVQE